MSAILDTPNADLGCGVIPSTPVWRFSLDQYHAMIDCGILQSGDPVEFLEGVLVPKMTRNPPHRIALAHLRDLLQSVIGSDWHVESQEAITLEASEPEPDIAVVRGRSMTTRIDTPVRVTSRLLLRFLTVHSPMIAD